MVLLIQKSRVPLFADAELIFEYVEEEKEKEKRKKKNVQCVEKKEKKKKRRGKGGRKKEEEELSKTNHTVGVYIIGIYRSRVHVYTEIHIFH